MIFNRFFVSFMQLHFYDSYTNMVQRRIIVTCVFTILGISVCADSGFKYKASKPRLSRGKWPPSVVPNADMYSPTNSSSHDQKDQPWLYFDNGHSISLLKADSRYSEGIINKGNPYFGIGALDVDVNSSMIFWTEGDEALSIYSAALTKSGHLAGDKSTVLDEGVLYADGIAVDWLFKHIFWADSEYDTINVVSYDGTMRRTLVNSGLDYPRGIVVDPENGNVYWSDWGWFGQKIEKCGMDGNNRHVIVSNENGHVFPNALTIDYVGRRLYWVDSTLEKIGSANLDGSDVKYVISGCPEICSPYSISVFENTLYWMDMGTIKSINTITGRNAESLLHVPGSEMSLAIKVYHDKLQDMHFAEEASALCSAKQCPYLCLPSSKPQNGVLSVSCVCADFKYLSPDGKSCVNRL